jgi:acyl carrier protein
LPVGEVGELCIAGAGLARGYRNRPDLTAERFLPHPFTAAPGARLYRTGDRARWLPDGQLVFLGRFDDQLKIRGFRIEPDEIVAALDALPDVQAGAVAVRDDGAGDRRLVAYIVATPGTQPRPAVLLEALREKLPEYMLPAAFVQVALLPLTANGKIDRAALPEPDSANTLRDDVVAPRTPVEVRLAHIVAQLLDVETVGVNDNFFLLGGHSLLGTQLLARLRDAFGVDLPLRTVFDHPTVEALAANVEQAILTHLEAQGGGAALAA